MVENNVNSKNNLFEGKELFPFGIRQEKTGLFLLFNRRTSNGKFITTKARAHADLLK